MFKDILDHFKGIDAQDGGYSLLGELNNREGLRQADRGVQGNQVGHRHPPEGRYLRGDKQQLSDRLDFSVLFLLAFYQVQRQPAKHQREENDSADEDGGKWVHSLKRTPFLSCKSDFSEYNADGSRNNQTYNLFNALFPSLCGLFSKF